MYRMILMSLFTSRMLVMNTFTCSGSTYGVYSSPGGGPTIVQDAVPRTQFDVDIYKLKAKQELDLIKLQYDMERQRKMEVWNINKPQLLEKLDELSQMVKDVRELLYV